MNIPKKIINNFLEYIIIALVVLESTSVYANSNILPIGILSLLCISMGIYAIVNINKILIIKKKKLIIYGIYLLYILIFMIINVNSSNRFNFFMKYIYIMSIFYFYINSIEDIKRFMKCYCNIIFVLCCVSLIIYFFGYIVKILPINYNVVLNWGNTKTVGSILNLHFIVQTEEFLGKTIVRNTGVFCEAPMYMLNLILCLTLDLFCNKKGKLHEIVLIIGIVTTISSTGYILLITLILLYFSYSQKMKIKFLILPIILIIAIFMIFNIVENKMYTRSYSVRFDDYIVSIESWKRNIVFGNGYRNNEIFEDNVSSFRSTNKGQSSSIGAVLVQGGAYLLLLYIFSFISIYNFDRNGKYLSAIYIILFFTTVFQYTALELFIISISINLKNLSSNRKNAVGTKSMYFNIRSKYES